MGFIKFEAVRVAASLELPPVTVSVADETHAEFLGCAPEVLEWVLFELFENAKNSTHTECRKCM